VASWRDENNDQHEQQRSLVCLACGAVLGSPFSILGSLRCIGCRTVVRPLDVRLVEDWLRDEAPAALAEQPAASKLFL
jgi:hypothetical protein